MAYQPQLAFQPLTVQDKSQELSLSILLAYLQEKSPFYQRLFKARKIDITHIKSLADLQLLPTTSKEDMQQHNMDFLCLPHTNVKEYTATSGTLGLPVSIALSEHDLQRLAYNEQQSFLCADGRPSDIFQLMLTLDRQFMAGMAYYLGIRQLGATLVRTGPGLPSMQWDVAQRLGVNSIVAVPSFILKMIAYAKEHGINLKESPVKKAICIGEGLRDEKFALNALGKKIAADWPIKLYSTYASTEMQTAFTECGCGNGGHHQPDLVVMEIIDDEGRQLKAGEYGELTITTLGVEAMPILRYRTGDICCYYDEPCACGRNSKRLSPVIGRKKQMIKYKGTTIFPPALFDLMNSIAFVQEYIVEVAADELGMDSLLLYASTTLEPEECSERLKPLLQAKLRVLPQIIFISAEEMQRMQFPPASRKQVRFIDKRI